ncbi:MAG: CDP-glycerol glycerophosphotransferase family protein [Actinobacteria bacterium]|nr:CDP-glycerol glycerophosphotransferase family protein [Actinomycetota bacterium]
MAQKFNRVETLARKALRARSGLFYSGYLAGRRVTRSVVRVVTGRRLGWVAWLQAARWVGPATLEIAGWAYERGSGSNQARPQISVILTRRRPRRRIATQARHRYESQANVRARLMPVDYGHFGFVATLDLAPVLAEPGEWQVMVRVDSGDRVVTGPFTQLVRTASAAHLTTHTVEERQLRPRWEPQRGLVIAAVRPRVREVATEIDGRRLAITVATKDFPIAHAALTSPRGKVALEVASIAPGRYRLSGEVPECGPDGPTSIGEPGEREGATSPEHLGQVLPLLNHRVEATDTAGNLTTVRSTLDDGDGPVEAPEGLYAYAGPGAALLVRDTPAMLLAETVALETGDRVGLRITGRVLGDLTGARLMLTGPRIDIGAELTFTGTGFDAFVPMLVSAWGGPPLAPASGRYVLRGQTADGAWFRVAATSAVIRQTPKKLSCAWFKLRTGVTAGRRLAFQLRPPLGDKEIGDYQQAALKLKYHKASHAPVEAVYFESFNGRAATCNPYALDREVARRFPDLPRYWGVLDLSVPVPEGSIPVLKGTKAWWDARFTSRYVITNEWLRQKFKHQPFQVVLQTWHGSMFKRIGLDRTAFSKDEEHFLALERAKWDILLAQNQHSAEIFRSAYAWEKPLWTEGYPRNDVLVTGAREPIRELLGIRPDQTAILYAPTWREENEELLVDFLDLPEMARALGDDYVILLRGHSRTLRGGDNVRVPGVIDVTSYPHTADIFLAADAMITDYSSVMFDFSVTGRPMIFFTPDLEAYRDQTRGVYFDLAELAPGPVAFTQAEVLTAIGAMAGDAERYAARYAAWQERFNAHDDGHSSERVIERLFSLPKLAATEPVGEDDLARTAKQAVRVQRRN